MKLCTWCDNPAITREWYTFDAHSRGEEPDNYRCADHRRKTLAPGTVSANIPLDTAAQKA